MIFTTTLYRLGLTAACCAMLAACGDQQTETPGTADSTTSDGRVVPASIGSSTVEPPAGIPPAAPDLAADTIPLRTPDGKPARYGLASGRLVQQYSGTMKGERTIVFDHYGMRERKEDHSAPHPLGRPGRIQNTTMIARPDTFGMIDLHSKSAWKMANRADENYLKSDSASWLPLGRLILAVSPGTRMPDTVINGYHCVVVNNKMPGMDHTIWVWRGITIREHLVAMMDTTEFWIETVELQPNISIADSMFQFPGGYKIETIREPGPGEQWFPPGQGPAGKTSEEGADNVPPGVAPPGVTPPGPKPPGVNPPGPMPPPMIRR